MSVHAIFLVELLGHTADSLELWRAECSCGWTVEGVSSRQVTVWWDEHARERQGVTV